MNIFTHLDISMKLKYMIEKSFNVKLRTASFLLGSIKPDISSRYINIPHYKKDSDTYIMEEIKSILETKIYDFEECTSHFSERLGIITHYLSDFFCYVHSEYFKESMSEHYFYEMKLSVYCILNSRKITKSSCPESIKINQNISSLFSYLDELHINYLYTCSKKRPGIDMEFAIKACTALVFSIITACMADSEENFSGSVGQVLL